MSKNKNQSNIFRHSLLGLCFLGIVSCTPSYAIRGNFLQTSQIESVSPGEDNSNAVLRKLGSPTTVSTFDNNVWYYIGQETEKRGILDPEVKDKQIVEVRFDRFGVVETIEVVDASRIDIPYSRNETPTAGNEITVMQQLLGNLGKFNTEN